MKAITEELYGHSFSASSISAMNQGWIELAQFAARPWPKPSPIDPRPRYKRVREAA